MPEIQIYGICGCLGLRIWIWFWPQDARYSRQITSHWHDVSFGRPPYPGIVTASDNKDYITVLLHSYYTTLQRGGILLMTCARYPWPDPLQKPARTHRKGPVQ